MARLGALTDGARYDVLPASVFALAQVVRAGEVPASRLLAAIQHRVRFKRDAEEYYGDTFKSARRTWADALGDCDDVAPLVANAYARAGWTSRVVPMSVTDTGDPRHVTAQVRAPGDARWLWAEATIPAELGEHPVAALRRLKVKGRSDVSTR